jgi:hypothetical protein
MEKFYFDMDGTIANLYAVPNWLEMLRAEDVTPYAEAVPMVDTIRFCQVLERLKENYGIHFGIISWCSKCGSDSYNKEVRKVKRAWLKQNFPGVFDEIHIVKYGRPKATCPKNGKRNSYLIDDEEQNREDWAKNEKFTIDPTKENLLEYFTNLEKVLES